MNPKATRSQKTWHAAIGLLGLAGALSWPGWLLLLLSVSLETRRLPFFGRPDINEDAVLAAVSVVYVLGILCSVRCLVVPFTGNLDGRFRSFAFRYAAAYLVFVVLFLAYSALAQMRW